MISLGTPLAGQEKFTQRVQTCFLKRTPPCPPRQRDQRQDVLPADDQERERVGQWLHRMRASHTKKKNIYSGFDIGDKMNTMETQRC
jgi:hypothetical protein